MNFLLIRTSNNNKYSIYCKFGRLPESKMCYIFYIDILRKLFAYHVNLYIILYSMPKEQKINKKSQNIYSHSLHYYNLYIFGLFIKTNNSVCAILSRLWYEIDIEEPVLF